MSNLEALPVGLAAQHDDLSILDRITLPIQTGLIVVQSFAYVFQEPIESSIDIFSSIGTCRLYSPSMRMDII